MGRPGPRASGPARPRRPAQRASAAETTEPGAESARATASPPGAQMAERPAVAVYPPPVGPAQLATATQTWCLVAMRRARSSGPAQSGPAQSGPA